MVDTTVSKQPVPAYKMRTEGRNDERSLYDRNYLTRSSDMPLSFHIHLILTVQRETIINVFKEVRNENDEIRVTKASLVKNVKVFFLLSSIIESKFTMGDQQRLFRNHQSSIRVCF